MPTRSTRISAQQRDRYHQIVRSFEGPVGPTTLRFRVGVATGYVIVSKAGHSSLRAEDVFGGVVYHTVQPIDEARMPPGGGMLCPETARHA